MVSQSLVDFLTKVPGINKHNLFVFVGNESTIRCLNASSGYAKEQQVSMEDETLQIEVRYFGAHFKLVFIMK
jgi:hypothetical protein